jgi:hypothetical protein
VLAQGALPPGTPGCRPLGPAKAGRRGRHAQTTYSAYFVKYQFSGLIESVGLCGVTPLRSLATSVSA